MKTMNTVLIETHELTCNNDMTRKPRGYQPEMREINPKSPFQQENPSFLVSYPKRYDTHLWERNWLSKVRCVFLRGLCNKSAPLLVAGRDIPWHKSCQLDWLNIAAFVSQSYWWYKNSSNKLFWWCNQIKKAKPNPSSHTAQSGSNSMSETKMFVLIGVSKRFSKRTNQKPTWDPHPLFLGPVDGIKKDFRS